MPRSSLEPLLTLAALSSVTTKMMLGTAVLLPIRRPLKLSQNLVTLSLLPGGRVMAGMGLGSNQAEFAAAGFDKDRRMSGEGRETYPDASWIACHTRTGVRGMSR